MIGQDAIFITLKNVAEFMNIKLKNFLKPFYGSYWNNVINFGHGLNMPFGKSSSIDRVNSSIELLGGIKSKNITTFY